MSDNSAVSFFMPDMRPVNDPAADEDPGKPQFCPFCKGEQGILVDHLLDCMWRIWPSRPHDALIIKRLEIMKPYVALNEASYKCPRCPLIVRGRGRLICHVAHACHLPNSLLYDHGINIWDSETNRLWEPSGPFPFLLLPPGYIQPEIREMVYRNVLCYTTIEIMWPVVTEERNLDSCTFLQNGTHTSLLALLRVNHQIYDEGRRLFYGHNTFRFRIKYDIPLFLISIGRENVVLLRDIRVQGYGSQASESPSTNYMDIVNPCMILSMEDRDGNLKPTKLDIWNKEPLYVVFARQMGCSSKLLRRRVGVEDSSPRFLFIPYVYNVIYKRGAEELRGGVVFEILERRDELTMF